MNPHHYEKWELKGEFQVELVRRMDKKDDISKMGAKIVIICYSFSIAFILYILDKKS